MTPIDASVRAEWDSNRGLGVRAQVNFRISGDLTGRAEVGIRNGNTTSYCLGADTSSVSLSYCRENTTINGRENPETVEPVATNRLRNTVMHTRRKPNGDSSVSYFDCPKPVEGKKPFKYNDRTDALETQATTGEGQSCPRVPNEAVEQTE